MITRHRDVSVGESQWCIFLYDDRVQSTTSCCNFDALGYRYCPPLTVSVYVVVCTNSN